jgi:[acyl-carrier-protein] S-malonyltransferase
MVMPTVLMFPGQGVQRVGMGQDVAERFAAARDLYEAADEALGLPLSQLMWKGPEDELTLTKNAQPAILLNALAILRVVADGVTPSAAAGHSLGEIGAHVAAGAIDPIDAIRLVRIRGEAMFDAGRARPGTMAAVLGLDAWGVERCCRDASTASEICVPANLNAPEQIVISGDPPAVRRAAALCKGAGAKRVVPLNVSGAFHSPLMEPAVPTFRAAIDRTEIRDPAFPVIATAETRRVEDATTAKRLLAAQLSGPVRWVGAMQLAAEVAGAPATFIEVGSSKVLTGLLRRIVPDATGVVLSTADEIEAFLEQVSCTSS